MGGCGCGWVDGCGCGCGWMVVVVREGGVRRLPASLRTLNRADALSRMPACVSTLPCAWTQVGKGWNFHIL